MPNQTKVFNMFSTEEQANGLKAAVEALRDGALVAFPTETVYGLGADAREPAAVRRIFAAKGRPSDNPLIVHVASVEAIADLTSYVPGSVPALAAAFWPGPLTLVMPKSKAIPEETSGGLDTVGIRIPSHPIALRLLEMADLPVAGPSANRSGRPSPTLAQHVVDDLEGSVAVVLDGGQTGVGVESTVLDLTTPIPTILRPGGVTVDQLQQVLGAVDVDPRAAALPDLPPKADMPVRSPGMKYTHYAPAAPALLVEGDPPGVFRRLLQLAVEKRGEGKIGLLVSTEGARWLSEAGLPENASLYVLGSRTAPEVVARSLFAALRKVDDEEVKVVLMEGFPAQGMGLAVMNRLRRAAGGRIVTS